jgi:mRNA-degrading endonuclease RelE of RelBE toxin-antitoxin system
MQVALAALALIAGDLAANPFRVGKALQAPLEGLYSARRGDDRILYRIDGHVITVRGLEHRRDAYRS